MAPAPETTAFVLVPGGFMNSVVFHKVTERLKRMGYAVAAVDNPSSARGTDKPPASMYDDAANIRSAAASFMDEGKDVVIAGNSYGGFIATEAIKTLSHEERKAASRKGGHILNLVYIASLIPAVGMTCTELVGGVVDLHTESANDFLDQPPEEMVRQTMSDVPEEEAMEIVKQCRPQARVSMHQKITYAGYQHVPTTFVVTENDTVLPPKSQHDNVDAAIAAGWGKIKKLVLKSDHVAMISHPDDVVSILLEAASAA